MENYSFLGLGLTLGNSAKQEPQNGAETSQKMTRKWFKKVPRNKAFCGGAKCPKPFVFLVFPCIPGARRIPKSEPKCTPAKGSFLHLPGAEGAGKALRFRVPQNAVFTENLLKSIDSIK